MPWAEWSDNRSARGSPVTLTQVRGPGGQVLGYCGPNKPSSVRSRGLVGGKTTKNLTKPDLSTDGVPRAWMHSPPTLSHPTNRRELVLLTH